MDMITSAITSARSAISRITPLQMGMLGAFIVMIVLVGYGYSMYKQSSTTTVYNANRENSPESDDENKVAQLMLFHADWCPHCKTAKPEWDKMKDEYDGKMVNGYVVVFIDHNCSEESAETTELSNKYNIEGYPTIKLIKDNQVIEYDAKPTKDTMETFLQTVL
jgi:thiol-disulfide isomerase/thioredoxin